MVVHIYGLPVNMDPIFKFLERTPQKNVPDCIIPSWSLMAEDTKNWSIATVLPDGRVTSIAEKKYPKGNGSFYGVIGCYYFKKFLPEFFSKGYISGVIDSYLYNEKSVMAIVSELLKAKDNEIWSITPKATAYEALQLMAEKDVGALLVLDEGNYHQLFRETLGFTTFGWLCYALHWVSHQH